MSYQIEEFLYGDELKEALKDINIGYSMRNHLIRFYNQLGDEAKKDNFLTFGEFLKMKGINLKNYMIPKKGRT